MKKPDDFIRTPYFENCADLNAPELFYIFDQKWFKEHKEEIRKLDPPMYTRHGVFIINDPKVRLLLMLKYA